MDLDEEMLNMARDSYKKVKGIGIAVSILILLLGIGMFFVPESATVVAMWLMVIGLFIEGVCDIIFYFRMPKELRDSWNLAFGIIWVLISGFLIIGGITAPIAAKIAVWCNFQMVIAFMIAFTSIFAGIKAFCTYSEFKKMGGSPVGYLISGILAVIVGLIVLMYPIGAVITLVTFYGLFLIIGGIALLCRVLSL